MQQAKSRTSGNTTRHGSGSGLVFVNVSDPTADDANRRLVRSCATAHSHRDPTRKPKDRNSTSRAPSQRLRVRASVSHRGDSSREATVSPGSFGLPRRSEASTKTTGHTSLDQKTGLLLSRASMRGGTYEPFGSYPVSEQPWFAWVLDYYRNIQLPPGIAVVQESLDEGRRYIDWHLRESITEPSFFYMQLLNACTPLVVEGRVTQQTVVWIRCMLIQTLNEAIADSTRALSTATILTVGSIALHERLYGDISVAVDVHGKALQRMIDLRGGSDSLGIPRIGRALLQWCGEFTVPDSPPTSQDHLMNIWAPDEIRDQHPGYGD